MSNTNIKATGTACNALDVCIVVCLLSITVSWKQAAYSTYVAIATVEKNSNSTSHASLPLSGTCNSWHAGAEPAAHIGLAAHMLFSCCFCQMCCWCHLLRSPTLRAASDPPTAHSPRAHPSPIRQPTHPSGASQEDIGSNRAEACRERLQELNTAVAVSASSAELTPQFLRQFQVCG
jgi:hypothetical protein